MNQDDKVSAKTIINTYSEEELRRLFWEYGELRIAPALARTIVEARTERAIETTFELKNLLNKYLPKGKQNKILAQIYQAIRIEVNNELEVLKTFLMDSKEVLKKDGRLSVISYHSLEDRLVKRFIRNGMFEGEPERDMFGNFSVPFKKVGKLIVPNAEEIKENNRARSAKLRIAQKL
jgi:16S rRNA (cytosine1402-N4)-methyltransferase